MNSADEITPVECMTPDNACATVTAPDIRQDEEVGGGKLSENVEGPLNFFQAHRLVHDLHDHGMLEVRKDRLLVYIFLILMFVGLNMAMVAANCKPQDFIDANYYVSFHMAQFWGVFAFTMLEALVLIATDAISWNNRIMSAIILFNVVASFATAFLFSFHPKTFEVVCHYIEYTVQILITGVNIVFVQNSKTWGDRRIFGFRLYHVEICVAIVGSIISIMTLIIYTGVFSSLVMASERAAHFCEFANDIFNGLFALYYAIISYMDVRISQQECYMKMTRLNYIIVRRD